jgi:hypothetical protein
MRKHLRCFFAMALLTTSLAQAAIISFNGVYGNSGGPTNEALEVRFEGDGAATGFTYQLLFPEASYLEDGVQISRPIFIVSSVTGLAGASCSQPTNANGAPDGTGVNVSLRGNNPATATRIAYCRVTLSIRQGTPNGLYLYRRRFGECIGGTVCTEPVFNLTGVGTGGVPPAIVSNPLGFSTAPGTINLRETTPGSASASLSFTPYGGAGNSNNTTLFDSCGLSNGFTTAEAFSTLTFVGASASVKSLTLGCTTISTVRTGTLSCSLVQAGNRLTTFSWRYAPDRWPFKAKA